MPVLNPRGILEGWGGVVVVRNERTELIFKNLENVDQWLTDTLNICLIRTNIITVEEFHLIFIHKKFFFQFLYWKTSSLTRHFTYISIKIFIKHLVKVKKIFFLYRLIINVAILFLWIHLSNILKVIAYAIICK